MKDSYKAFPPMAALELFKFGWKSVLTVEHSPLKKLHPQVAHMLFLILGFMWSGIFAAAVGSIQWFGLSAFIHILIILASLPPFCDSSNMNWKEGYIFNYIDCHWKYELYYSLPFWFIDNIVPGIIAIYLLF